MANFTFNVAKGRVVEFYNRVKANDPVNSALILVPLMTTGLETQAVLQDKADLAAVLVGTTDEQVTMGRKVLTDIELAALPAADNVNDRFDISLPTTVYAAAAGAGISQFVVCYDNDTTTGTDANIIPLTAFDFVQVPNGSDIQLTGAVFFRAT